MLHRGWIGLTVLLFLGFAQAQTPHMGLLTEDESQQLNQRISQSSLEIRRHKRPPPDITIPGNPVYTAQGWWVAKDRVITASIFVQGWPRTSSDIIEVRVKKGPWQKAAVGLMDARTGLAVLDVQVGSPPGPVATVPKKNAFWIGQRLYTPGTPLRFIVVSGKAVGDRAYYWAAAGNPLPLGTPVFSATGMMVSIVGLKRIEPALYLLPFQSFATLFERQLDWMP